MISILLNNKKYSIPTEWNELSKKQLLEIMNCLFISTYTAEQSKLKLLKILAGMTYFEFFKVKPIEMEEFLYLSDFLLAERNSLTKQLLPEYEDLYGPSDELGNLIMNELVFCDSFFMAWTNEKENVKLLDQLCAVLYRPGKPDYNRNINPDGDIRIPFNPNECNWRAETQIKNWPMAVKLAIVSWYDACRWKIVEDNEEVFGGSSEEVSKYGLLSVIRRVAQGSVLGNFEAVSNTYVSLVMIELNESIAEAKAQEKKLKA